MLNTFSIDDMSHGKIGFINWIVCFVKCRVYKSLHLYGD